MDVSSTCLPMPLSTKSCDFPLNLHMPTKHDKIMRCQDHDTSVSLNMFHDLLKKKMHRDPSAPLVANLHHHPGTRNEIIAKNFMGDGIPVSSPKKKLILAWNDSEILGNKIPKLTSSHESCPQENFNCQCL